jgi:hypothetical protein
MKTMLTKQTPYQATNQNPLSVGAQEQSIKASTAPRRLLNEHDLTSPASASLSQLWSSNPALVSLYTDNSKALHTATVTIANGKYLPALLHPDVHECPLWVFWAHSFSGQDAEELAAIDSLQVFNNQSGYPYLVWATGRHAVCVEGEAVIEDLYEIVRSGPAKLLVAFIGADSLYIRAIDINEAFISSYELSEQSGQSDSACRNDRPHDEVSPWVDDDDINFGEDTPAGYMSGPSGEDGRYMLVRRLGEYALFVPSREPEVYNLEEVLSESVLLKSALLQVDFEWNNHPAIVQLRGKDLNTIVPATCEALPVLIFALPTFMGGRAELCALSKGAFLPVNIISSDSQSCAVHLVLEGVSHRLTLPVDYIQKTLALAFQYHEIILAFIGEKEVWLRYYQVDDDWHESLALTTFVSDNMKPQGLWTAEEVEVGHTISTDVFKESRVTCWCLPAVEVPQDAHSDSKQD